MNTFEQLLFPDVINNIKLQPFSQNILTKTYQKQNLNNVPIEFYLYQIFHQISHTLAACETTQENQQKWESLFLWALENGAIPADSLINHLITPNTLISKSSPIPSQKTKNIIIHTDTQINQKFLETCFSSKQLKETNQINIIFTDQIIQMNPLWFNIIPQKSTVIPQQTEIFGHINLTRLVEHPFSDKVFFDWERFRKLVRIFTRLLDNCFEISPFSQHQHNRCHSIGILGLSSTMTMMKMKYGSPESIKLTEEISKHLALAGWETGIELAKEKGSSPIFEQNFQITSQMIINRPEMSLDGFAIKDTIKGKILFARYSRYMQKLKIIAPEIIQQIEIYGCRFAQHAQISSTTIASQTLGNNAGNGIAPTLRHHKIISSKKNKETPEQKFEILSFEFFLYKQLVNENIHLKELPDYFITLDKISSESLINIQTASQKWLDAEVIQSIPILFSKNKIKNLLLYANKKQLRICSLIPKSPPLKPTKFQQQIISDQEELSFSPPSNLSPNLSQLLLPGMDNL